MSASYDLARNRIGAALDHIAEACKRATKKTGALCYTIKARVLDIQRDRSGRAAALLKALEYDPDDLITRHQYGVALSRAGQTKEAIEQFSIIIETEKSKIPPSDTLLMTLKTRIINLRRLGRKKEVEEDLGWVKDLFKSYPYLQQKIHFDDIEDSEMGSA